MTLISFTWKKSSEEYVPELSRSSTDETPMSANPFKDDCSFETKAPSDTSEAVGAPPTPEGLRPRPTARELRQSLGLPRDVLLQLETREGSISTKTPSSLPALPPRKYTSVSPDFSRSSLYSRGSSSAMVAQSPSFNPGQTLTAVGALLAQHTNKHALPPLDSRGAAILPPRTLIGVLPPREWLDDMEGDDGTFSDSGCVGYHHLNDSVDDAGTTNRVHFMDQAAHSPATSTTTSFPVSPIRRGAIAQPATHGGNMSFSSQVALVESGNGMHLYDFDPIIVAGDHLTNVSAISQSVADDSSLISNSQSVDNSLKQATTIHQRREYAKDDFIIRRKQQNQRKAKEQLLLEVVERLQDDLYLLEQVEQLHEDNDGVDQWFVKANFQDEGLLTGYSVKTSNTLLSYFQSLVSEMDTARPEDFFLSPSQFEGCRETHDDLRRMIAFMIDLIKSSPPILQQWVCNSDLRTAMGIPIEPESPETIRGGDTSMFSLPSESTTPHTSNLSMSSTITTKLTPMHLRAKARQMYEQASSVRRTTEILGTILQKMSCACNEICRKQNVVRATEDLKRLYLQLVTLSRDDLNSFIQAFSLEERRMNENEAIVRQISNDENEGPNHVMACALRQQRCSKQDNHSISICSPNSDDMRSATMVEEEDHFDYDDEYEDLRRTVGSTDYEGGDMDREQPEESDYHS